MARRKQTQEQRAAAERRRRAAARERIRRAPHGHFEFKTLDAAIDFATKQSPTSRIIITAFGNAKMQGANSKTGEVDEEWVSLSPGWARGTMIARPTFRRLIEDREQRLLNVTYKYGVTVKEAGR